MPERFEIPVPAVARGPLRVHALLRYRSAPQEIMDELFGKDRFPMQVVDMASVDGTMPLAGPQPRE